MAKAKGEPTFEQYVAAMRSYTEEFHSLVAQRIRESPTRPDRAYLERVGVATENLSASLNGFY
jgi:hypothetical protein